MSSVISDRRQASYALGNVAWRLTLLSQAAALLGVGSALLACSSPSTADRSGDGATDAPTSVCTPDAGCAAGQTCWQAPSGAFVCATFAPPPPREGMGSCAAGGTSAPNLFGACCTGDSQCTAQPKGRCIPNSAGWCGGVAPPPGQHCDYSGWCLTDQDCGPAARACVPSNYAGADRPICLNGPCRTSADCKARPGGVCAVATGWACTFATTLYCRYPGDPCRIENLGNDCPRNDGRYLVACAPNPDGQGAHCIQILLPQ